MIALILTAGEAIFSGAKFIVITAGVNGKFDAEKRKGYPVKLSYFRSFFSSFNSITWRIRAMSAGG